MAVSDSSGSADGSSSGSPDTTTGNPNPSTTGVPPITTAGTSPVSTVTTVTTSPPPPPQTSTSSSGGESSVGGSSTGVDACNPTEEFQALVWVGNGTPPGAESLECVIVSVDYETVTTEIELDCGGLSRGLSVWSPSPPIIPEIGAVTLDVITTSEDFSTETVVKLATIEGELILAASNSRNFPGDAVIPVDFFNPFGVSIVGEPCEPQAEGSGFIFCYEYARQTLEFNDGRDPVQIVGGNRGFTAGYEVALEVAELRLQNECDDVDQWYQWAMYRPIPVAHP